MPPPTLPLSTTIMPSEDPHAMALDGGGDRDGEGPRPRAELSEEGNEPTAPIDTHDASTPSGAAGGPRMSDPALGRPTITKSALRVRREEVGTSSLLARSTVVSPNNHDRRRPRSERRVRGLWSNENSDMHPSPVNHFAKLHDDTIGLIFTHLNVFDANESTQQVCQRWRHVLTSREYHDRVRGVDATEYVRHVHEQQQPCELSSSSPSLCSSAPASVTTSRVVERTLAQYRRAKCLVIRDVGHCLTSACYVPNLHQLTELTLTSYDDLSDLSVHAMLLSPTTVDDHVKRASGTTSLHVLRLEDCPLLTNEAVRSVALTCPHLHTLSLKGCRSIDSIVSLRAMWKATTTTTPTLTTTKTSGTGRSAADRSGGSPLLYSSSGAKNLKGASEPLSLLSLFAASSSASSAAEETDASSARRPPTDLDSLFIAPPPSPTSVLRGPSSHDADQNMMGRRNPKDDVKGASRLQGLFAPPCPRRDDVNNPHTLLAPNPCPRRSFVGSGPSRHVSGALTDVDVSGTGVSPEAVLEALSLGGGVAAAPRLHLERLFATGPSQPWLPRHTWELAYLVDVALLKATDVTISEPIPSYHEHRLPFDDNALSLIPSH